MAILKNVDKQEISEVFGGEHLLSLGFPSLQDVNVIGIQEAFGSHQPHPISCPWKNGEGQPGPWKSGWGVAI